MAFDLTAVLRLRDQFTDRMRRAAGEARRFSKAADTASSATDRVARSGTAAGTALGRMSSSGGKAFAKVQSGAASVATSIATATVKTTALGASIAAIGAGVGVYKATSHAMQLASNAEQANIAFETMLGSAERAQKFLAELTDFAAATPFDLPGLRDNSRRLLAFGFALEEVLPMLTAVGNATSGLGLGGDGINRITLALGQMRAKSKVSAEEMLQLTEAGIPAWEILAQKMQISTAEVMKLSEKGLIPADKAINALIDGMNKRFPDMMAKQSKSLQGLYNTMKETFENKLLVRWGEGISAALKPRFEQIALWIDNNGETIKRWGDNIARIAERATDKLLRSFEGAFKYVRTQYLDNPRFKNLTVEGKFAFVIDDLLSKFNRWLESDGGQQIKTATSKIVNTLATSLDVAAGPLASVAYELGTSLAAGVIDGFRKTLAEHPFLAAVAGGLMGAKAGAMFGPWGIAVGAVSGTAVGVGASLMARQATDRKNTEAALNDPNGIYNRVTGAQTPPLGNPVQQPNDGSVRVDFAGATRRYNGLNYVPRDNYPVIAHKGERVQTKAEADQMRQGTGGRQSSGVLVTGNTFIVRQDTDIDAIADAIVRKMEALP